MAKTPISAIVLTHQSDRTLDQVLAALNWCDEIVVVDSGSQDRSIEIARKYQAQIFNRTFDGYGPQKQFAVDQAKHKWVFVVDSDEVPSAGLQDEIQHLMKSGQPASPHTGFEIQIKLVFLGKILNYSGAGSKYHLRLFDKSQGNFNSALVHEEVMLKGSTGRLDSEMLHYSYLTLEDYFSKFNTYTTYAARDLAKGRREFSKLMVWTSFPVHFFKRYILKFGFLDGYHGFLWSLFSALYPTVKYAKLAELSRAGQSR